MQKDSGSPHREYSELQLEYVEKALRWYRINYGVNKSPRSWLKIAEDIVTWDRAVEFFPEIENDECETPDFETTEITGKADSH